MGSLGEHGQMMALHRPVSVDAYEADAADTMKHMVMGMIAVALVLATVIGGLVLSGAVHELSGLVCASVDLPSPVQLS